jgi:serine/threonine protein phosphatase PrpC
VVLISGTITRPLRTLAAKAAEIGKGNLDIEVPEVKSRDEVGELSRPGRPPEEWLPLPDGFLLGVMEESVYETRQILLAPGDMLLLYTDGLTEAMNSNRLFYEERRLNRVAEGHGPESPEGLVREVLRSVRNFADSEPQSDDITMLALSFRGRAENSS